MIGNGISFSQAAQHSRGSRFAALCGDPDDGVRRRGRQTGGGAFSDASFFVAVLVSVTLLGESMTAMQVIGGALILGFTLLNELSPVPKAKKE